MMLNERETGTSAAYKSLTALITTPESVPRSSPKGVYSTNITSNSAVIGWQEIPRKEARGVLLGYRVQVYNRYTGRYGKEIITNDTSVILTDLSLVTSYRVSIKGYTAVGSGPRAYHNFTTLRCHTDLKGESGMFSIDKTHNGYRSNCSWTIGKGVNNIDFIVIKFTPFDLEWNCIEYQHSYVEVADVNYEAKVAVPLHRSETTVAMHGKY
ncbi:Down syndrome cell adhesion molecule-like protein 1 [Exaiptasia diaphana]|nr:Down syndrome cell adhesion molecule-like protein 1 [Exaiptasia diaphana]